MGRMTGGATPASEPAGFTITIPPALVAAIDRRVGGGSSDDARARWLLAQCLPNELKQELDAIERDTSEALLVKLAALPTKTRTDLEAAIGQALPTPKAAKVDDAPVVISK